MITRGNYGSKIGAIGVSNLPKKLQEGHQLLIDVTENGSDWSIYEEDEAIRETIDLYLESLNKWHDSHEAGNAKREEPKKSAQKKSPSNKVTKKVKTSQKAKVYTGPKSTPKQVKQIREEVKYIKRFVALHNKPKKVSNVLTFVRSLQRSIELEMIRKASPLAGEIEYIQKELIKNYNTKRNSEHTTIVIPDNTLARMVAIAGGEAVYKSVGIIRRFVGMKGKEVEEKKVDSLLKSISNAKISSSDPFHDRILRIAKALKTSRAKKGHMEFDKAELGSLEGILECCCDNKTLGKLYDPKGKKLRRCRSTKYSDARSGACSWNKGIELGKIYDPKGKRLRPCKSKKYSDAGRGACSYNKGLAGVMSAEDIVNQTFDMLPFSGRFAELIGRPEKNFTMMLHGEPGNGKSSFLIQFAKYLSTMGSVLYVSSEEYGSVTLKNLVKYYMNPIPKNITFAPSFAGMNAADFDFVVIDSINDLGLKINDFKSMREKAGDTGFVIVLQHTKAGDFKGGKDWEHLVQIGGEVSNYNVSIFRNRYGVKGSWNFRDEDFASYMNQQKGIEQRDYRNDDFTYNY